MKRVGNLFGTAFSRENLHAAYLDARRNKRGTHSCFEFERCLGSNLAALHDELMRGTYKPLPYNTFTVTEPKPRVISAPAFRDRVVQHAIYRVVQPIFDRSFIDQSFACRPGKGTHAASDYVQAALRAAPRDSYVLQLDIRRFYYSIQHDILDSLIRKKIKDPGLLHVMRMFMPSGSAHGVGLPIGNLLSQLYALIYLNPLDHFIKRDLGIGLYARYVDDFVLIGITRLQALEYREHIIEFLGDRLQLALSKSSIARVRRGVNFVGFRTWASRRFVRRHALHTFRAAVRAGRDAAITSCLGHARRTASLRHMQQYNAIHRRAAS